jgi:Putative porin
MTAPKTMHKMRLLACSMLISIGAVGATQAQEAAQVAPLPPAPSESAMVNLVRLLVKQGVLKRDAGEALMKQAEVEAEQARAAAATQTAQAALPDAAPGSIRVPYIPETVRNRIRDEIRTEVMATAKSEGWASADQAAPDWTKRISLFGDIRFRSQSDLYSKTNAQDIFDYAAINALGPFDFLGSPTIPYLNTRTDRVNRLRVRARLGLRAKVSEGVTASIAVASGDDDSPISTNQSLGGGLGKRDLWLDQAYIKLAPSPLFQSTFGRFPNPFVSTELLFDEDVRFDGVAAEFNAGSLIDDSFTLAIRGGAFPLDFGSANFPNTSNVKQKAPVKYLYSGQITAGGNVFDDVAVSASAAYHSFQGVRGQLSTPCPIYLGATECSTDSFRVQFPRKGNTLLGLRQFVLDDANPNATYPQLLGLTFDYDILDINASVRVPISTKTFVTLSGNYVRNLGFKASDVCRNGLAGSPLNNGGSANPGNEICDAINPRDFVGGRNGYQLKGIIGFDDAAMRGQWNAFAGYRYLESDAVLDSLTDSEFRLGGTNAKGYFIGGKYGIFDNVSLGGRWLSANQISGPSFAIDVLQIDLEAKF